MYESIETIQESQISLFRNYYPVDLANYIKNNGGE